MTVNNLFPVPADWVDLPGLHVERAEQATDGALCLHVRASSTENLGCPVCGTRLHASGSRVAHYTDVPREGRPVALAWRRRHFRCRRCRLPSHQRLEALNDSLGVTDRLLDWIRAEAASRPFAAIAKECGISPQRVIPLFRAAMANSQSGPEPRQVAVATVPLASNSRPLLLDATGAVVNVFRSLKDFETELKFRSRLGNPVDVLVADPALDRFAELIRAAFRPHRTLANPVLASRQGVEMMLQAAREAIAAQAMREGMAAKTGEILFARGGDDLGRNARRRLGRWASEASQLRRAYELKNDFARLCSVFTKKRWADWRDDAIALADVDRGGLPAIDYAAAVAVFERYADGLAAYQAERSEWRVCERTLAALGGFKAGGTRSFSATRAAVLQKFGVRASDEAKGALAED